MPSLILQSTVLVLDKQYSPVEVRSIQEVLPLIYVGKALAMANDFTLHDMDDWITYSARVLEEDSNQPHIVRSPSVAVIIPEVIVLKDYIKTASRFRTPGCNRHSIFRRDQYTCQYCHKKFVRKALEIDHVVPQSKGGPTSWTNCVTSCKPCNSDKGAKSVEEMGYKLLKKPIQPTWKQLFDRSDRKGLWETFLK